MKFISFSTSFLLTGFSWLKFNLCTTVGDSLLDCAIDWKIGESSGSITVSTLAVVETGSPFFCFFRMALEQLLLWFLSSILVLKVFPHLWQVLTSSLWYCSMWILNIFLSLFTILQISHFTISLLCVLQWSVSCCCLANLFPHDVHENFLPSSVWNFTMCFCNSPFEQNFFLQYTLFLQRWLSHTVPVVDINWLTATKVKIGWVIDMHLLSNPYFFFMFKWAVLS